MIEYNLKNGKLEIDPSTLTVQVFNAIWNYDKSTKKSKAANMLTYVFTLCDQRDKNPFRDVDYDKKEAACKKNAFGDPGYKFSEEEIPLIDDAIAWFQYLNSSPIQRLSRSVDKMIDKMSTFLDTQEIKSMADYKSASDELKKIEGIIKSKASADKTMREEMNKVKSKVGQGQSLTSKGIL